VFASVVLGPHWASIAARGGGREHRRDAEEVAAFHVEGHSWLVVGKGGG
jgi:hypothetical protein